MINKGKIQPDKSYRYTCLKCGGAGYNWSAQINCTHCYSLDLGILMQHFAVARGERYYALLKAILSVLGKDIYDDAITMHNDNDGLSMFDIGVLMLRYDFPHNRFKPLIEWLEETGLFPTGLYERIKDSGFRFKDAIEAAQLSVESEAE